MTCIVCRYNHPYSALGASILDDDGITYARTVGSEYLNPAPLQIISLTKSNNDFLSIVSDKRRTLTIDNSPMSELRNFPHWDTMLSKACKLGVITSQMFRFNRRCFKAKDFIKETSNYCRKVIREGYNRYDVLSRVMTYRHWDPRRGRWVIILRELRKMVLRDP